MVPTIVSITPAVGHTGGRTLVEIVGTGFALPPAPPATGSPPDPAPSVQVTIGGVPALQVWAISSTLLRCLTPIHDPSGTPARPARPETSDPGAAAVPASDVVVQNLDANGDPIPGETATLAAAFSFVRPRLDQGSITARVVRAFIAELRRQVIDNVNFAPNTDYDPDTGDGMNVAQLASLPGIAIVDLKLPRSQVVQNEQDELSDGGTGFVALRPPVLRDAQMTLVGVSDNKEELLTLEEALDLFFRKNPELYVQRDDTDPSFGSVGFDMQRTSDPQFGTTTDGSNICFFSCEVVVQNIPRQAMPGLPATSIPGAPTERGAEPIVEAGQTMATLHLGRDRR